MAEVIYKGNDHVLELAGLQNGDTLAYINSANVEATLKDSTGTEVTGQTWPLVLGYVAASDGVYRGVLDDSLALVPGAIYTAEILVDAGADLKGRWDLLMQADYRR
jgi:hypothetical protein